MCSDGHIAVDNLKRKQFLSFRCFCMFPFEISILNLQYLSMPPFTSTLPNSQ